MEIYNAIIRIASISYDQGFVSAWLTLDYGGEGQGFGGFKLYKPKGEKDYLGYFVYRCFQTLEVNEWNDLINLAIRVKKKTLEDEVYAIGHIIKDQWFSPIEEFEEKFHGN